MKNTLMKTIRQLLGQSDEKYEPISPRHLWETEVRTHEPVGRFQYTKEDKPSTTQTQQRATQWAEQRILEKGYVEISMISLSREYNGGGYNLNCKRTPVIRAVRNLEKRGHIIARLKVPKNNGGYIVRYSLVN